MREKQRGEGMGDDEKRIETQEKRVPCAASACYLLPAPQLHEISHQGSQPSGFLPRRSLQPLSSSVSPAPWLFSFPSSCQKMLPGQIYKAPTGFWRLICSAGEAPSWWGRGCGEEEGDCSLGSDTQTVGEGEVEGATG